MAGELLTEFLEVAIHVILFERRVYPEDIFTRQRAFGVPVTMSRHPEVNAYIKKVLGDARPLFDARLPARRRLFLTATPRLLGGDGEVASMDDAALYGPVPYRLTRGEAEARELVVPLHLVFVNATVAYEELTRRLPGLRVLLDERALSVSREHAEQAALLRAPSFPPLPTPAHRHTLAYSLPRRGRCWPSGTATSGTARAPPSPSTRPTRARRASRRRRGRC